MEQRECPNCHNVVPGEAVFCPDCGMSLSQVQGPDRAAGAGDSEKCPNCGSVYLKGQSNFCQACGFPLKSSQVATREEGEPPALPVIRAVHPDTRLSQGVVSPGKKPSRESEPSRAGTAPKVNSLTRRKPGKIIGIISIFAVVFSAAGVGIWFWWQNRPSPDVNPNPIQACQPQTPNGDFVEANLRDLSGSLSQDSYFSSGQDYLIADDASLTVPKGKTLIIEPGARVKFGKGARLVVEGSLSACGKKSRPILFTADTSSGSPGYWGGVEIRNADPQSIIGHAVIQFAGKDGHASIRVENTNIQLEDVSFTTNQWYALSLDPNSSPRIRQPFKVENGPAGWEVRGGTLSKTQKWGGDQPMIVNGVVDVVENAVLTIPAGFWVKFQPKSALLIHGSLNAAGTADQHIHFTSANDHAEESAPQPAAGDWVGLQFASRKTSSILAYADIAYAGGDSEQRGCLWMQDAAPQLSDLTISNCAAHSISADIGSSPQFQRLTLSEPDLAQRYELRGSHLQGSTHQTLGKVFLADGKTLLVPVVTGWITVDEQARLDVDPGSILMFSQGKDSGLYSKGSLNLNGSAKEPVVLTSWRDPHYNPDGGAAEGDWGGLQIENSSSKDAQVQNVEIRFAGGGYPGCLVLKSASPTIQGLVVRRCASYPVSGDVASLPTLGGLDLQDNTQANLWEVRESKLEGSQEWKWTQMEDSDGSPIVRQVTGFLTISQEASLNLQPGLVVKFQGNAGLYVQGALLAEGTQAKPILLTSGKDPQGGGSEGNPQPGDWTGVVLEGSQDAKKLSNVKIAYAGNKDQGVSCLILKETSVTLASISVSDCAYYPVSSDLGSTATTDQLSLENNQPANEWSIRESRLEKGRQQTWNPLPGATAKSAFVRTVTGRLTIAEGATLNLGPGLVVKFSQGTGIWNQGSLVAQGKETSPIILTSWHDPEFSPTGVVHAGDWCGLVFDRAQGANHLSWVQIRYAGGEQGPRGSIALNGSSPQMEDVAIQNGNWYPISVDANSQPRFDRLSLVSNNPENAVEIRSSAVDTSGETIWSPVQDREKRWKKSKRKNYKENK